MKALVVRQPWAGRIARGDKTIELRSWATKYRGPVIIIAGSRPWGKLAAEGPLGCGDCVDGPRPCPFVSCRHHLYLDVVRGSIKLHFPDLDPDELDFSCSLDLAELGGLTLEQTGATMNITRERVRQLTEKAELSMKRMLVRARVRVPDLLPEEHDRGVGPFGDV